MRKVTIEIDIEKKNKKCHAEGKSEMYTESLERKKNSHFITQTGNDGGSKKVKKKWALLREKEILLSAFPSSSSFLGAQALKQT